jgi:Putative peptidoglycan binding domain/LysM domain
MAETYTVQKGDCLESIAKRFGFGDYKVIYNHPSNAALKQKRPKPNLLQAGDSVFIPDKELKEENCATDQKHKFQFIRKKVKLRIIVKDDQGNFFADKKYELKLGEKILKGSTDGKGFLEQEIPADINQGELKVFTEDPKLKVMTWNLGLGSLGPVEENDGIQGRLKNLGYYFDAINGQVGSEKSKSAIKAFQGKNSMTKTGDIDDSLRNKLRDLHDKKS